MYVAGFFEFPWRWMRPSARSRRYVADWRAIGSESLGAVIVAALLWAVGRALVYFYLSF